MTVIIFEIFRTLLNCFVYLETCNKNVFIAPITQPTNTIKLTFSFK